MTNDINHLRAAYQNTSYWSDTSVGRICMRVGQSNPAVDALLELHGVTTWAYVTACNPGSQIQSDVENGRANAKLLRDVQKQGLPHFPGAGVSDDSKWPEEPSMLILGISREAAGQLGRAHGQKAVVIGRLGEPSEMLWC
jgi:hypothetical protein